MKDGIGIVLYISGYIYIQVFNIHGDGWHWKISGVYIPGLEYDGKTMTMKQAKIDAVIALTKYIDLINEHLKLAQQNTPGFSPPEK